MDFGINWKSKKSGVRQQIVLQGTKAEMRAPLIPDAYLLAAVILLVCGGIVMVYSTTGVVAHAKFDDSFFYVKKQMMAAVVGFVGMLVLSYVRIDLLKKYSFFGILVCLALLLLPLIPGLGERAGGASRWIKLGFVRFQPAELVKIMFVIFLAGYLERKEATITGFVDGVVKPLCFLVPVTALLLLQPDFGSSAVICAVAIAMALCSGVKIRYAAWAAVGVASAGAVLVWISPYRMARVLSFLNPFSDPAGKGYQLIQSLIAVGMGNVTGSGLGNSQQKLFFLPAAHTDFIFGVISEEFGFVGGVMVIAAFLFLLWRGLSIAARVSDNTFKFALATGLTLLLVIPALLNVGVVTGILPTKGMVLPFVGYGGSSLVMSLFICGLLLSTARSLNNGR